MIQIDRGRNVVTKIIYQDNLKTVLSYGVDRFLLIKKINNTVQEDNYLIPPAINSVEEGEGFIQIKLRYVDGKHVRGEKISDKIFFNSLKILHEKWGASLNDVQLEQLPWNYFSKKYWDFIQCYEPTHPSLFFFKKFEQLITENSKLVVSHNDIHLGNLIINDNNCVLLDMDEVSICDFRNDIGCACANIFYHKYKNSSDLINFTTSCVSSYLDEKLIREIDVLLSLIYGLRKLYNAEIYYKMIDENNTEIKVIKNRQLLFTEAINKIEFKLLD